jgi:hypothetical protein
VTDSPVLDEREHWAALKSRLDAALAPWVAYDDGSVPGINGNPGEIPDILVIASIERRYVEPMHAGRSPRSGWRIALRHVGRLPAEAQWAASRTAEAMEARLVIDGHTSTPPTHESSVAVAADDGRFSGTALYTYAL